MCLFRKERGTLTELHGRIGWRIGVLFNSGRLGSIVMRDEFVWTSEFVTASYSRGVPHAYPRRVSRRDKWKPYYGADGLHVWKTRKLVESKMLGGGMARYRKSWLPPNRVLLKVRMYGKAYDHDDGYRVETCVIDSIVVHTVDQQMIKNLIKNYPLTNITYFYHEDKSASAKLQNLVLAARNLKRLP